jgi:hypothetical protein
MPRCGLLQLADACTKAREAKNKMIQMASHPGDKLYDTLGQVGELRWYALHWSVGCILSGVQASETCNVEVTGNCATSGKKNVAKAESN